ncbi:MAG TPA: alpha/beta hydrolase [Burkholderiales bacterium]|nr:alpha/beta hydrolase [Burkholderiales bacterium]
MTRTGFLERPDCRIHYQVAGSGPPIVFAHGLGGTYLSWWQQVAYFANKYTCVVFSHRGFTPSSPVAPETVPDSYAEDLGALIQHLGLADVCLVAQSMGGWSCLEYALREPENVQALVMACTAGPIDCRRIGGFADTFDKWLESSEKTAASLQARDISVASGERMEREQPALARLYRQITELTPAEYRAALRVRLGQSRVKDPELLRRLPMPVFFLTGDEDWVFPPAAGAALAAMVPNGRAACVKRAGHSVYFERAAEFNRLVHDFLKIARGGE